jgi:hypothetical protein
MYLLYMVWLLFIQAIELITPTPTGVKTRVQISTQLLFHYIMHQIGSKERDQRVHTPPFPKAEAAPTLKMQYEMHYRDGDIQFCTLYILSH